MTINFIFISVSVSNLVTFWLILRALNHTLTSSNNVSNAASWALRLGLHPLLDATLVEAVVHTAAEDVLVPWLQGLQADDALVVFIISLVQEDVEDTVY